ncbi:MAG TPA: Holliday junction resolvase RuvX [Hyphomonas sp.]|nr:Holliday junction resolvase RuvX [Hyphomonas sp.]MCB9971420.1 Holliday junction resolvase RuvX [Hyphomonas sp.]HPE47114.1 Holliday junction resolvase RuvX [Hyphomonas sp.]
MSVVEAADFPATGPLLGLDPGTKTIGIASCDGLRMIASPVETIAKGRRLAPALERLFALYDERGAVGLVLGLPLNMDGSEGPRAQSVRALAWNILKVRDVPILLQDERLSTAEAEWTMMDADLSRKRRAERIDASAAAIILKAALERLERDA